MRHTIRFQPSAPPPPPRQVRAARLRRYGLMACVGAVLAVGGFGGMALNHNPTASGFPVTPVSLELPADSAPVMSDTAAIDRSVARLAPAAATQFHEVEITPPDDPFLPSHVEPKAVAAAGAGTGPGAAGAGVAVSVKPAGVGVKPAAGVQAAAAPPAADQATPKADELSVTGIVQGDTPVAVVKYAGQSFFLKIGDQVADTWRLVEIKERSVLFQLGARRVEVPIKGGSSE